MDISIIMCTCNRAESLLHTFESLIRLDVPPNLSSELLLVDNNSSDSTRDVVAYFQPLAPFDVKYFFEERQGLSYARNRGVRESRGEILAFTDDDVAFEKDWIVKLRKAFDASDIACACGRIVPVWENMRPSWLTGDLYDCLGLLDLGDEPRELDEPHVCGANFIVRASMFEKYGMFAAMLDRIRGRLYSCEESGFIERLLAGGEKVFYIPNLVVHHVISTEKMKKSYFRKWMRDNSELSAIQMGMYSTRTISGVPYYAVKELLKSLFDFVISGVCMKQVFKKELSLIRSYIFVVTRLKYKYL